MLFCLKSALLYSVADTTHKFPNLVICNMAPACSLYSSLYLHIMIRSIVQLVALLKPQSCDSVVSREQIITMVLCIVMYIFFENMDCTFCVICQQATSEHLKCTLNAPGYGDKSLPYYSFLNRANSFRELNKPRISLGDDLTMNDLTSSKSL